MHYSTTRRRKVAGPYKLDSGIPYSFTDSTSLMTIKWADKLVEHGMILSSLHCRAIRIMQDDPTVIAVTTLEW